MTKAFPPVDLEVGADDFACLGNGIVGYELWPDRSRPFTVRLQTRSRELFVLATPRDLQRMFEVSGVAISSLWPMREPPGAGRERRFSSTTLSVLSWMEFIVEGVDPGPTFGVQPNWQGSSPPGETPPEAAACCQVTAALLFSGDDGRLLIAPQISALLVSSDDDLIDRALGGFEQTPWRAYAAKRWGDAEPGRKSGV